MSRSIGLLTALLLPVACGGATQESEGRVHRHHDHDHHHAHHAPGGMQHDFSNVEQFEAMFDAPDRDGWQRPAEVLALLDVARGATVADLGTGTGYFLPFLSVAAGSTGRVLALDAEPAMVEHVRARAAREGLANVEARAVGAEDPRLEPGTVDRVLIVNTWHHLPDRPRYAGRLREALRPGGTILVVDFTRESPEGPPPEVRIPAETVVEEMRAGGLTAEIVSEQLGWQYVVRASRVDAGVENR